MVYGRNVAGKRIEGMTPATNNCDHGIGDGCLRTSRLVYQEMSPIVSLHNQLINQSLCFFLTYPVNDDW